jgi:ribosome-associated protein
VTDSKPSKSARKRAQQELQALGEQLISLNDTELSAFNLDERLCDAVRQARTITSHGALRRQKQLIGKLMRELDPEPIRAELAKVRADEVREKKVFARAEKWRDRLVRERSAALDAFIAETGDDDADLRSLLAELEVAFSERDEKTVKRRIFRRVHDLLSRRHAASSAPTG